MHYHFIQYRTDSKPCQCVGQFPFHPNPERIIAFGTFSRRMWGNAGQLRSVAPIALHLRGSAGNIYTYLNSSSAKP
jgi:hypothetical protein